MTEPTTAEIRERHDTIDRYNGAEFSDYIFADEDRGILLDRLEAAEQTIKKALELEVHEACIPARIRFVYAGKLQAVLNKSKS